MQEKYLKKFNHSLKGLKINESATYPQTYQHYCKQF